MADWRLALAWNAALFVVFAAHHSVMARAGAKAWLDAAAAAPPTNAALYVWIASALLVLVTLGAGSGCPAWSTQAPARGRGRSSRCRGWASC